MSVVAPALRDGLGPSSGAVVLAGRRLQPDVDGSELSVFGDEVWDLTPAVFRRNSGSVRLDFGRFIAPFRQTAKEAVWARLHERCGRYKPGDPHTAAALYWALQRVQELLSAIGLDRLDQLDADDLNDWLANAITKQPPTRVRQAVEALRFLSFAHPHLSGDRLSFTPWGGRGWYRIAGLPGGEENRTPRIPEAVFQPLVRHALLYVQHYASDILAATDDHETRPHPRSGRADDRVAVFITGRRADRRGIPGSLAQGRNQRGAVLTPAWRRIAALAGLPYSTLASQPRLRAMIEEAAAELGLDDTGSLGTPGPHPDTGLPWREPMTPQDLLHERRMLLSACYTVIAFLSGMRDSELFSLRRGCARRLGRRGEHDVWKVRGTTFKGDDAGVGADAEWVVLAPVVDAIRVLERLTAGDHLLVKTSHNQGREPVSNMNRLLRTFIAHLNNDHDAGIPDWPITTRQFRRTVAWYIANRPFGVVAGMIQFSHVRTSTFLGYAGTSPSGFAAEIEAEGQLGQLADIIERYEDWKLGAPATGPGAHKLAVEFARVQKDTGDLPGQVVDRRRLERLLGATARTLHVGPLNDCLFERKSARCLALSGREGDRPMPTFCQPTLCANSRIDRHHLPAWREQEEAAVVWLGTKRLAGRQRESLEHSRDEAAAVIASVEGTTP